MQLGRQNGKSFINGILACYYGNFDGYKYGKIYCHAHKTNQMYKLLEGGIKKLKSALISVITTAGFDLNSPCYKL